MKMRRARQRKKLVASSQVYSGPSYEAFTISTPRGLSAIGTPVDASLTGRKRPASDAEQSHDSASFGTLVQHVVVERGDVKDSASACQQHSLVLESFHPSSFKDQFFPCFLIAFHTDLTLWFVLLSPFLH